MNLRWIILKYLLKSDFYICQEPSVKEPTEEKIQAVKKQINYEAQKCFILYNDNYTVTKWEK